MARKRECRDGMKKRWVTVAAAVLCSMVLLSACGSKEEEIPMGRHLHFPVCIAAHRNFFFFASAGGKQYHTA